MRVAATAAAAGAVAATALACAWLATGATAFVVGPAPRSTAAQQQRLWQGQQGRPALVVQQQGQPLLLPLLRASNQLEEEGLTVAGVVQAYEAEKAAKRAAEDKEYARLRASGGVDDGEGGGGFVGVLRRATESKAFLALEGGMLLLTFALLDGAYSGDWTKYGLVSYATEDYLKAVAGTVLFAHVCLAGLSSVVAEAKGRNDDALVHILRTLAVGGLDFLRVAVMPDRDTLDARELAQAPPLNMEISTFQMAATKATDGLLLSTTIKTLPGKEGAMRKLLVQLIEASQGEDAKGLKEGQGLLSTMAVNQDPEDRRNFLMLQRFPSLEKMKQYQNAAPFKAFTTQAFALLSEPLGLYIANERKGRLTEPNYPFGPGGEGGRDDAIYSSPTNLDGSQSGAGQVRRQEEAATRG